MHEHAHLE
jgi:hypothetical protein